MKPVLVYLGVVAGGGAIGAVGMGAYNAVVVGIPEEAVVAEAGASAEEHAPESATDLHGGAAEEGTDPEAELSAETHVEAGATDAGGEVASAAQGSEGSTETAGSEPGGRSPVGADPDQVALNVQRLAQIFAAMQPEDAAAVLEQLDDAQLENILLGMQGRNAAPILAEIEPVRAAALSRRVLEGGR